MKASLVLAAAMVATLVTAAPVAATTQQVATAPPAATQATAGSRWYAFLTRTTTYTEAWQEAGQNLVDALDEYDTDNAVYWSSRTRSLSLTYIRWLDAHKPATCYKAAWTATRTAIVDSAESDRYMNRWLAASPWGSDADYAHGSSLLNRSTTKLDRAAKAIDATHC